MSKRICCTIGAGIFSYLCIIFLFVMTNLCAYFQGDFRILLNSAVETPDSPNEGRITAFSVGGAFFVFLSFLVK